MHSAGFLQSNLPGEVVFRRSDSSSLQHRYHIQCRQYQKFMACVVTVNRHDIYINDGLGMCHPQCLRYIYTGMVNRLGSNTGNHYQLHSVAFAWVTDISNLHQKLLRAKKRANESLGMAFSLLNFLTARITK